MKNIFFILILFLFSSCNDEPQNNHENVLPHKIENNQQTELSKEDKARMAQGKGRSVRSLTAKNLKEIMQTAKGKTYIFNFWKMDCEKCQLNYEVLEKVLVELGEEKIQLVSVNMDEENLQNSVNTYIREKGWVGDIFQLVQKENLDWTTYSDIAKVKIYPSLFFINNEQEVQLFYDQSFDYEELMAVLGSVVN